jgi:predicted membrane protein (TIGR00267 family)
MPDEDWECILGCDDKGNYSILHKLEDELELTDRFDIVRRHFAIEVFDGVLPVMAIVLTGLISIISEPFEEAGIIFNAILLAAIGTAIAMFVAGFGASYLTERAEGKHLIEEIENAEKSTATDGIIRKPLTHSLIVTAERESALVVSLITGLTPALAILVTISPLFLSAAGILDHIGATYVSLCLGFIILFLLGVFLAKVAKESIWMYGMKTVMAGVFTLVILLAISKLTGTIHG